jgi:hypothetical protein
MGQKRDECLLVKENRFAVFGFGDGGLRQKADNDRLIIGSAIGNVDVRVETVSDAVANKIVVHFAEGHGKIPNAVQQRSIFIFL